METVSRRDAMKVAATVGITAGTAALAAASAAAEAPAKKPKGNSEPTVASTATAESCGARELFAVVDEKGTLVRGLHAVSARSLEPGCYEVIFNRDVRRGAYVATTGGHGYVGVPVAAVANVMGRANNPRGVFVFVSDLTGAPLAATFHLVVICPEGFA
jgi:hypothetical protein